MLEITCLRIARGQQEEWTTGGVDNRRSGKQEEWTTGRAVTKVSEKHYYNKKKHRV